MKPNPAAVLIATGVFAAFSVAQNAPSNGAVEGTVVNSATGAGIEGASVVLTAPRSARYEATTDAAGHFKITGMTPGTYRTSADKNGFASPPPDLSTLLNSGLRVAAGGDPLKVEIKLTPLNAIQGRILGPDGKPAAGIEVSVYPNINAEEAATDGEGRFALHDLRPASYLLIARPPASAKPQEATDGTKIAMVTTYYPSVADRSLARTIDFRGQGDSVDYEIRMQTALVHRMSGIVLDEEGKPAPGTELTMFPAPEGTPEPMGLSRRAGGPSLFALGLRRGSGALPEATAIAGKDGHFEFPAVRSGDWRIDALSDSDRARGTASARVGRSDVDDLQIRVAKPFKLTGTIEWKGQDPSRQQVSNTQSLFSPVTLINPDGNEVASTGIVESSGLSFENVLPGRYAIVVKPGLAAQIFLGEIDVTGQTFSATANGPRLRTVLKTWSGSVRGMVEKGEGATVVLIPQRVDGVAIGETVVCGADGSFELSEVSPGDYYIAAFDRIDGLVPSTALLGLVPSRGRSLKVEEGSTANVMVPIIAVPR